MIALGIIQAIIVALSLFYWIPAFTSPHTVMAGPKSDHEVRAMSKSNRAYFYLTLFVRWLGMFFILFHAAGALTSWMPDWWGLSDEDDYQNARFTIDSCIALFGSIGIMASVEDRVERAGKQPVDHATLVALLTALDTKPRDTFQRDRALSDAEFVLQDRVTGKLWKQHEYRDQMLERLREIRTKRP